jgi:hypothetical protein
MVRIGAFALMVMAFFLFLGCSEKSTASEEIGVQVSFPHCLSFEALIWVDDTYVGAFSSERPAVLEIAAGSHTLYAKSNLVVADSFYCWTQDFSVASGKLSYVELDCYGHGCR